MDCLGTYFAHAQSCDVTRVQSATHWTALLQASFKKTPPWSHLPAPSKPPSALGLQAPLKPPWSPFQAPFKPLRSPLQRWRLQASFKPPWGPLQTPSKPPLALKAWSPFQAPFKPLRSPLQRWRLQASFKPPWSPVEAPSLEAPLKPPWSPLQAPLKPSEGKAPFDLQTFVPPPPSPPDPSSPLEGGTSEPAPAQLRPVIPSQPHLSSVLTASQLFNFNLPLIFPENEDIIMDNARQAAAAGFVRSESIPLLALTDESYYHRKLHWTLRFPVPPPDTFGSARRFSSTVTFRQGPHSAEALEGALRLAAPFSYNNDATHVLFNSPFLRLPDLSVLRPPRIGSLEDPSPPEHAVREWLNNRAPRLIPTRYRQYHPVPLGLVDFFNSNIHLVQVATLIETHQCNDEDATAEARKHKRDHVPHAFLRVTPTGTVMPGSRLPDLPSASPTPETLPHTALAPPFRTCPQTRSTSRAILAFLAICVHPSPTPPSFLPQFWL